MNIENIIETAKFSISDLIEAIFAAIRAFFGMETL